MTKLTIDGKDTNYRLVASVKLKGIETQEQRLEVAKWLRAKAEDVENESPEDWDKNRTFSLSWF